jgi:Protein kinase domain
MGQVYLAFTPGGRPVALKVMHPHLAGDAAFRGRFQREVTAAGRVHGIYTAQVLDADPAATPPWLATAYVPGPSLREAVAQYGPMPARTVAILIAGVAEALQVIHATGLVHRDLKPSNVLLAPDGPRVIDFGIARAVEETELTGAGFRVGSPQYMAPEQAAGQPVSGAADVFALGALAVYAAVARPAFGEGPDLAVLYRIRYEEPDLTCCPPELRALVSQCLAKNPADRPSPAKIVAWCRSSTAGWTGQIAQPWLPPQLTRVLAVNSAPAPAAHPAGLDATAPADGAPPGAPDDHATSSPVPSGPGGGWYPPTATAPSGGSVRRRTGRRPAALAFIAVAIVLAGWWLMAQQTGHLGAKATGQPPASRHTAWLSGTWAGPASQPTGRVTRWEADLSFSRSGRTGTFRFPTLGCSGELVMIRITGRAASARQHMTVNSRRLCVPDGLLRLRHAGANSLDMIWQDPTDSSNVATARLTRRS